MALTNKELPFDPRRKETPVLGIKKANLRAIKSYKKQNQRFTAKSIKNLIKLSRRLISSISAKL